MTAHAPPTSLSAFLLACLADDEAVALAAQRIRSARWHAAHLSGDNGAITVANDQYWERADEPWRESELTQHLTRHDPARVLANVAALRAVIALHGPGRVSLVQGVVCETCADWFDVDYDGPPEVAWPCPTLRALAQPFAGRPGFREDWANE